MSRILANHKFTRENAEALVEAVYEFSALPFIKVEEVYGEVQIHTVNKVTVAEQRDLESFLHFVDIGIVSLMRVQKRTQLLGENTFSI